MSHETLENEIAHYLAEEFLCPREENKRKSQLGAQETCMRGLREGGGTHTTEYIIQTSVIDAALLTSRIFF